MIANRCPLVDLVVVVDVITHLPDPRRHLRVDHGYEAFTADIQDAFHEAEPRLALSGRLTQLRQLGDEIQQRGLGQYDPFIVMRLVVGVTGERVERAGAADAKAGRVFQHLFHHIEPFAERIPLRAPLSTRMARETR